MKKYFAFDLETTGVDVTKDEPIEIAFAIVPEEGPYRITSFLVKTDVPISPEAQRVHGICPEVVRGGLNPSTACQIIFDIIDNNEIHEFLGFNCFRFDIPMLANFLHRHHNDPRFPGWEPRYLVVSGVEDPALWYLAEKVYKMPIPYNNPEMKAIADKKVPYGTRYNLGVLCDIYGIKNKKAHSAEGDLVATIELWRMMKSIRRINGTGIDVEPASGASTAIGPL